MFIIYKTQGPENIMNNIIKIGQDESSSRSKIVKGIILRMKIQRMIKVWKKMVKKSRQRINILKEWVVTEEAYIKDLNLIIEKIQKPMLQGSLITREQDRILFPNLDAMLKLSKELLTEVNGFLSKFHPHKTLIGNSLINFYKYFIIYREYCNNFYKAQKIIKQVKTNPKSESIGSSLAMDIQSYIIKPVQRPPKYQLLLRQYLKALDPKHKDYEALTIAISKYHDVNEQNNQSMDLQIRGQKMIELDKKYSGIINASRVFLFEELTKDINQTKLKLYVFNDLILVVKLLNDDREEGYKKIFLDGQSFVNVPMDGKYFASLLFICGNKENLHCHFGDNGTRDKVYEKINNVIHQLCRKESNRVKRKKTKIKMIVMKIQQIEIKTKPKLRITVAGVEKRLKSSLNLNYDTFYILKIQAPIPNDIFQYSYLKFEEILAIQKQIKLKNKTLNIPILDDKPYDMGLYDVKKNMTKIIQSRQIYIERFINFVLRSEQLEQFTDFIVTSLNINQDLWQFINVNQRCTCQICSQQKQSISFQEFKQKKQFIKSSIGSPNGANKSRSSIDSFTSQSSYYMKTDSSICLFNNFLMPNKISEVSASELNTLQKRLTWLETKQGRIDYSLIQKNQGQNNIKINICLLSLKQDEIITVKISKKSTALEVLDQIATKYAIQTMRDFGLFLQDQGVPRLIDRDEKLWEALRDIQYQFEEAVQSKQGGFWKKLSNFKKWGEQIITGRKSKLYIKKYLFVSEQLQIKACQENPQRYSIIVQEVFYRFKHEILLLNKVDTKKLCALYYVINYMDKLAHLNEANFQLEKIKNILPQSRWSLFEQEDFQIQVYNFIKSYEKKMENTPLPLRRKSKVSSTMFSQIQVAYSSVINLVYKIIGWNSVFFYVNNYDPPSLPGSCTQLLLGVNRRNLIIMRPKQLQPLVQIQLSSLNYKVTFKSIFIYSDEKVLRFDGQMIYDIKKLIQSYKLMVQKFNQP